MKAYIVHNDELGYDIDCPTYKTYQEADNATYGKCRAHSVVEVDLANYEPCRPVRDRVRDGSPQIAVCENCALFAGWEHDNK